MVRCFVALCRDLFDDKPTLADEGPAEGCDKKADARVFWLGVLSSTPLRASSHTVCLW